MVAWRVGLTLRWTKYASRCSGSSSAGGGLAASAGRAAHLRGGETAPAGRSHWRKAVGEIDGNIFGVHSAGSSITTFLRTPPGRDRRACAGLRLRDGECRATGREPRRATVSPLFLYRITVNEHSRQSSHLRGSMPASARSASTSTPGERLGHDGAGRAGGAHLGAAPVAPVPGARRLVVRAGRGLGPATR